MEDAEADGAAGGSFDFSVAVGGDGSRVVVGAPNATSGPNALQAAQYVFAKPTAGFGQEK